MHSGYQKFSFLPFFAGILLHLVPAAAQENATTNKPSAVAAPAPAATNAPPQPTLTKQQKDADAYVQFGITKGEGGDLPAAIAAFEQAMSIDPQYAPAYRGRGFAYSLQDKLDLAIVDYDKAISLDPKYLQAIYFRGVAKGRKGDFDEAIVDFNRALAIDPKNAQAYYNRGHAKYFLGDLNGAFEDTNLSINLDPDFSYSYFIRGLVRRALQDRAGAKADFQKTATSGFAYGTFWLWIIEMEGSERGIARTDLSEFVNKSGLFKDDPWSIQIAKFLLEKQTQNQFIAQAQNVGKKSQCEAWFYAGIAKRFSGDNKGALACFQQAIATNAKDSEEYIEAQREIAKLQAP